MELDDRLMVESEETAHGIIVVQVAIVVRDLERTVESYERVLGWGPWRIYDFRDLPHVDTRVGPGKEKREYSMRTAACLVGGITFEIIEPVGPSPYTEFLEERGEGLHHIQLRGSDPAALRERLQNSGMPYMMGGKMDFGPDEILEYDYHDGSEDLHLYIESTYGKRERLLGIDTGADASQD